MPNSQSRTAATSSWDSIAYWGDHESFSMSTNSRGGSNTAEDQGGTTPAVAPDETARIRDPSVASRTSNRSRGSNQTNRSRRSGRSSGSREFHTPAVGLLQQQQRSPSTMSQGSRSSVYRSGSTIRQGMTSTGSRRADPSAGGSRRSRRSFTSELLGATVRRAARSYRTELPPLPPGHSRHARVPDHARVPASPLGSIIDFGGRDDDESAGGSTIETRESMARESAASASETRQSMAGGSAASASKTRQSMARESAVSAASDVGNANPEDLFNVIFDRPTARTNVDLVGTSKVILPRDARGDKGTYTFHKNRGFAIQGIDNKLGVPSYLHNDIFGFKDNGDGKDQKIQNQILIDQRKMEKIVEHCTEYDFAYVFNIYPQADLNVDPDEYVLSGGDFQDLFDTSVTINMLKEYTEATYVDALMHQINLNRFSSDETSLEWALAFLKNSVTDDLHSQVAIEYNDLPDVQQGPVMYLYLVLQEVFGSCRESVDSLQKFLKHVKSKGVPAWKGENVYVFSQVVKGAVSKLEHEGQLHADALTDVMEGLCRCTVPEFKEVMQKYKNDRAVFELENNVGDFMWDCKSTKEEIFHILSIGVKKYKSMAQAKEWSVPSSKSRFNASLTDGNQNDGKVDCWNCNKRHKGGAKECRMPRDEEAIKRNREAFLKKKREAKAAKSISNSSSQSDYKRTNDWSKPQANESVRVINGVAHCFCKLCGDDGMWVKDHSKGYHHKAQADDWSLASLKELSPKHPLFTFKKTGGSSTSGGSGGGGDTIQRAAVAAALKRIAETTQSEEELGVCKATATALSIKPDF